MYVVKMPQAAPVVPTVQPMTAHVAETLLRDDAGLAFARDRLQRLFPLVEPTHANSPAPRIDVARREPHLAAAQW